MSTAHPEVAIVGGGQAALSVAYFLRRAQRSFVILDAETAAGGAWQHAWPSLQLFSPAAWSSIAGWPMPPVQGAYPTRAEVIAYLQQYEARYALPVERPVWVSGIERAGQGFVVRAGARAWACQAVVSATGTWRKPFTPSYPGQDLFQGVQLHSAHYAGPAAWAGKRVLVVGGGNSGAQIVAELSQVAHTQWVTPQPPAFLPDAVDGRVLFERATARWKAAQEGRTLEQQSDGLGGLGDIVVIASVAEARARGVLQARRPFTRMTAHGVVWPDGTASEVDGVLWCTGFAPALDHLDGLGLVHDGRMAVQGTQAVEQPGLWLVGYGEWTGMASATLVGVMRSARSTALEIDAYLGPHAGAEDL